MPVMPGYRYADEPHAMTVVGSGYRYGCHSAVADDYEPRGQSTEYIASAWSGRPVTVRTEWLAMPCGHSTRGEDSACAGCVNA